MKQHFLPQAYLREFVNKDHRLHSIDCSLLKYGRQVFDQTRFPAEVCRSKDFYTLNHSFSIKNPETAGLTPMHLENSFHGYEKEYPRLVAKIKNFQKALPINDAHLLVHILFDIKIRSEYYRKKMIPRAVKEVFQDELRLLKSEIEQDKEGRFSADVWDKFESFSEKIKKEYIESITYHAESHLKNIAMARNRNNELHAKLSEHLPNFLWKIYTSNNKFITTDNPGFSVDLEEVIYNTKFDRNVLVFFPLTPSMCLSINTTKIDLGFQKVKAQKVLVYEKASDGLIDFINDCHKHHMTRYIFSNNEKTIKKIVSKINEEHTVSDGTNQKY